MYNKHIEAFTLKIQDFKEYVEIGQKIELNEFYWLKSMHRNLIIF